MFDSIFNSADTLEVSLGINSTLISIIASLLFGLAISSTYYFMTSKRDRSVNFIVSLIILPAVISVVIMLVGGNIARAFSMAGVFTLVRFRSVPGDSKDISLIFLSMAVGLTTGMGYLTFGAAITVILCLVILISSKILKSSKGAEKQLRIIIPEDMNYHGAFDDLFEKYTTVHEMQRVKTANLGTLFELTYRVILKNDAAEKEFIDELRCRNGNLNIMLSIFSKNEIQL
ncbi:MAG: hypothetical protein K0S47_1572 [Herbinix sp.]|jgi:hypothetical protein|nr:hypothetical protein [Herbinix sp.]